jgi:hypothetical protein
MVTITATGTTTTIRITAPARLGRFTFEGKNSALAQVHESEMQIGMFFQKTGAVLQG